MIAPTTSSSAAILYAPDGYEISRAQLMGRHVAGNGFLRAAVGAVGDGPVIGCGRGRDAQHFFNAARSISPQVAARWIDRNDLRGLSHVGVLHRPDPGLPQDAYLRLRCGPAQYSLTGVTHTTASSNAMEAIASMLAAPLARWDALICTSIAVLKTVEAIQDRQAEYLRWRHGQTAIVAGPETPVIPLGVHCDDFVASEAERVAARSGLGVADDEVVALFVGRMAFAGKAHPQAMYEGLERAARRTGKKVALVECGWSPTEALASLFRDAAHAFAPNVRRITANGLDPSVVRNCWSAADMFVSLSDNIQETFGLTPVEAMAAGLPCVVTDWNGYRETVRHGVDGFCVRTWAPTPGAGGGLALDFETGAISYDERNWRTVAATSLDLDDLADAFTALIENPELRRTMGAAGRARAQSEFDWSGVYLRYEALWDELRARRLADAQSPDVAAWLKQAPTSAPAHPDPFEVFGHYPTDVITPATNVWLKPGGSIEKFRTLASSPLWTHMSVVERLADQILAQLSERPVKLASVTGYSIPVVGILAKMGLVGLSR